MALPDLDILVAIVEGGSLTAAAQALDIPRATLSRRLQRLEEEVGAVLIHRTTRTLVPTEAGQELYRHARPIVDAVATATSAVRAGDGVPRGLLRVTLPPGQDAAFGLYLSEYLRRYPEVRVEVTAVSRHVDLAAEGFDVGVRAGQLADTSLIARRLLTADTIAVASPDYFANRSHPQTPSDLDDHSLLAGFWRGEQPVRAWPLRDGSTLPISPRFATNELQLRHRLALDGLGIALLPAFYVGQDLESKRLVPVLADAVGAPGGIWVVYPERRLMLPRVRAFIDGLVEWSAQMHFAPGRPL